MAATEGVNTLQGRIESFAATHHLSKRRASSTKKRGPAAVSWPHLNPLPLDLARAGFFYKPSSDSNDNCECFLCHVKLDGWEHGDDPIAEHLKHSAECGWAIGALTAQNFSNDEPVDEDPMSERLLAARVHTFGDVWPYEQKKGWKPKVAKLAAAGWTYDPSPEYDDAVTCNYCNLSLDGWEPKDDPFVEHQKRCPDCPYFGLVEDWTAARTQAKGLKGKGKGRASRGSKASRLSTQSIASVMSEAPSQPSLADGEELAGHDESMMSNATITSTTGKGKRKKAAPKATKKTTRGKKAASVVDASAMGVDSPNYIAYPSVEPELEPEPPKAVKKTTRGKKASSVIDESAMDVGSPNYITYPSVEPEPEPEPPKRQTRRKASKAEQPSMIDDTLNASQSQRPTRGRGAKAKAAPRMSEDESQLHSELQAALDATIVSVEPTPKAARGTKRTSDGAAKIDSSVVVLAEEPPVFKAQPEKPKRGRKPKVPQQADAEVEEQTQPRSSDASIVPPRVSSLPRALPKSKKGKKTAKITEPEQEPEPEPEQEPIDELDALEQEMEKSDFDFAQSIANPSNPYAPTHGTPDHGPPEPSPAPSTPTPVRVRTSLPSHRHLPIASPAPRPAQDLTPTSSPQSSDAENKPPSSRPASARPPLSVQRIPLAQGTPNRQSQLQLSPSKRTVGGFLRTELPWSPTDIETVFLASPMKRNLGLQVVSPGKENAMQLAKVDIENLDGKGLREVVKRVREVMGRELEGMSVEEWVRWNATKGEERLRGECEALVMAFEKEGGRALRCLEGIEAA